MQDTDRKLSQVSSGNVSRIEFIKLKNVVLDRLREVKAFMRDDHEEKERDLFGTVQTILIEVREIKEMVMRKKKGKKT